MVQIVKRTLSNNYFSFNAFALVPNEVKHLDKMAIFTHGYTASKSDCLPWAQRLSDSGLICVIFDLPGHHLGSLNKVDSFEDFKKYSTETFVEAYNFASEFMPETPKELILGGHSLGALLSLKALSLDAFKEHKITAIGVGFGLGQHKNTHLFETDFYQKTLNIRRQLVDENLDSDLMFPWIKEEKLKLNLKGKRIHLITGKDDVVVGEGGMEALAFNLESQGNIVTTNEPNKLPHHEPTMAASYIMSFLRKEIGL